MLFAVDGAKFMLRVTCYAAGKPDTVSFDDGFGLSLGERRKLPGLEWDLQLDSVSGDAATFVVQRSG
jgi:hypothetical protein